jgi:Xaa-Pro aminopeptidase
MTPDLATARALATALFEEVERRNIVRAEMTEASIAEAILELGISLYGTRQHWHRRLVRSGPNTRLPFAAVSERTIAADDIVSLDIAPVFENWEADFGRTYVVGSDPAKHQLQRDLELIFKACQDHFVKHPDITGAELYDHVLRACAARGWGFGGSHAGHLIGHFPFSRGERDDPKNRIRHDNHVPMSAPNPDGSQRTWILEVHLLDPTGAFGGFYEDILNDT